MPGRDLAQYLARAEAVVLPRRLSETAPASPLEPGRKLRVGVDLGTAYLVLVVLDEDGTPVAGEWQFAQVVRDGLVVDFIGATDLLKGMKERVERRIGRELTHAVSGYPPGVAQAEVRATGHVLEAAGFECTGLIDEPSAANNVLQLDEGVVVDVGGGTTGIAVLREGRVIYTADEPTGGTHFTLVIAGSLDIPFEEAEQLKTTPAQHTRLLPVVRPVMEKVASITARHVREAYGIRHNGGKLSQPPAITLVGGTSAFKGMAEVVQEYTGFPASVPPNPMFVTPLGMALQDGAG